MPRRFVMVVTKGRAMGLTGVPLFAAELASGQASTLLGLVDCTQRGAPGSEVIQTGGGEMADRGTKAGPVEQQHVPSVNPELADWEARALIEVGVMIARFLCEQPPPSPSLCAQALGRWARQFRDCGSARLAEQGSRPLRQV